MGPNPAGSLWALWPCQGQGHSDFLTELAQDKVTMTLFHRFQVFIQNSCEHWSTDFLISDKNIHYSVDVRWEEMKVKTFFPTYSPTHTHTLSLSLSLSLSLCVSLTHRHLHTYTHRSKISLLGKRTFTFSLWMQTSKHARTHAHTHTLSLSLTHTHTQTVLILSLTLELFITHFFSWLIKTWQQWENRKKLGFGNFLIGMEGQ